VWLVLQTVLKRQLFPAGLASSASHLLSTASHA